jgi:hypothetical protein
MAYSSSDFASDFVNYFFANNLISAAAAESDDLEIQGNAAMAAVSDLMQRANVTAAPAIDPSTAAALKRQAHAAQFMAELLDAHETLTEIAELQGARTLADCMYMLIALQKGTSIEVHHPSESNILDVIQSLPSSTLWLTSVSEVFQ